ncbi:RNA polymerase subunit sigma, partial [Prevotella copri]|nr:RNA polymerase subunit sigma [Segatella copri]
VDEVPDDIEDEESEVERVPPAELTRMIGELPDGYRLVLNMFVFEQKSHKEIAQLLGIKESSSASQYLRAKKLLGKKVKDYLSQADCSDNKELNHINEKSNE